MKRYFQAAQLTCVLFFSGIPAVSAQTSVDFRDAVRSSEPALRTVVVSQQSVQADPGVAANGEQAGDAAENQDRPQGPRIEWLDPGNAPRIPGAGGAPRGDLVSAAFAVDESMLIAYAPGASGTVRVEDTNGDQVEGTILATDFVSGLAAIQVEGAVFPSLLIGTAATEPGMPVISVWIDDHVLHSDAGMVSTRPTASGSGIGFAPKVDFGGSQPMVGAPLLDAEGTVVGAFVPGRQAGLVCVPAAALMRLVQAATDDPPHDLKRGLVGIQFQGGGPLVLEVSPDSGAAEAGIQAGDLVEQVGAYPVRDSEDVVGAVASARAGDAVEMTVKRGDETLVLSVVLGEHPQQHIARSDAASNPWGQRAFRWELDNGQAIPLDQLPDMNLFPPGLNRIPMDELFRQFQDPGNRNRRFRPRAIPDPNQPQ